MNASSIERRISPWLLQQLGQRWTGGNARAMARRIGDGLQCPTTLYDSDEKYCLRFRLDLSKIHLGGLGERVECALFGGDDEGTVSVINGFDRDTKAKNLGFPLAFCLTDWAYKWSTEIMPRRFSLVLGPTELAAMLSDENPQKNLERHFRLQISRLSLSPYSILRPAEGLFFGRQREQDRLIEDFRSSYAIAGPGRIGKSSLLKRYAAVLRRSRDPRSTRLYELDFMSLGEACETDIARFIAMNLSASRRAERMTTVDFGRFLRDCRNESGGPLELLLDETDLVCTGDTFRQLGQAAKEGHVRLVLGGRKRLYEYATRESSSMAQRMTLMRLEPLADHEARTLLRSPLEAMGISIAHDPAIILQILERCGRLPHLLQLYGSKLVEMTVDHQSDQITSEMIEQLEAKAEFARSFLAPLEELSGQPIFRLAQALLRDGRDRFETCDVMNILRQNGTRDADAVAACRACDELVVSNILAWDKGAYRVANQAMRQFALNSGLLK